jgi:hypothetical protein
MTLAVRDLLDALFRDTGVRVASAEVLAVDNAAGALVLEVAGAGIPEGVGEVKPVFSRFRGAEGEGRRVTFEPVAGEPGSALVGRTWPSWGPP